MFFIAALVGRRCSVFSSVGCALFGTFAGRLELCSRAATRGPSGRRPRAFLSLRRPDERRCALGSRRVGQLFFPQAVLHGVALEGCAVLRRGVPWLAHLWPRVFGTVPHSGIPINLECRNRYTLVKEGCGFSLRYCSVEGISGHVVTGYHAGLWTSGVFS